MRLFLIAGEASGDALGAALMAGLKLLSPGVEFHGVGGPLMTAEGLTSCYNLGAACTGSVYRGTFTCTPTSLTFSLGCTGYRLPIEAEWEYATRAGTTSPEFPWSCGGSSTCLPAVAWYRANADSSVHPVGLKAPNDFGLYDVHGNAAEWVWDGAATYPAGPVVDYFAAAADYGILRGGWFDNAVLGLRTAARTPYGHATGGGNSTVRLVRTAP